MQRTLIRRVFVVGLTTAYAAMLALALPLSAAQAHAAYVSSTPKANEVLTAAPTTVTITFAQNLSPQGLSITVYGNKADVVSTSTAQNQCHQPQSRCGDDEGRRLRHLSR